jgi:hypothetical protein
LHTIFKEFLRSVLHPCRDLQMGFKGEVIQHKEVYTLVKVEEDSYDR